MTRPPGDDADGYEVGYRKPPRHSRFQPGRSGNPKGRPKGSKNLKTDLTEELAEKILVREGERAERVTKQRALLKALMAKALRGDVRALAQMDALMRRLIDTGESSPDGPPNTLMDLVRRVSEAKARDRNAEKIASENAELEKECCID